MDVAGRVGLLCPCVPTEGPDEKYFSVTFPKNIFDRPEDQTVAGQAGRPAAPRRDVSHPQTETETVISPHDLSGLS